MTSMEEVDKAMKQLALALKGKVSNVYNKTLEDRRGFRIEVNGYVYKILTSTGDVVKVSKIREVL